MGTILVAVGVFRLGTISVHDRYAAVLKFVQVVSVLAVLDAVRDHFTATIGGLLSHGGSRLSAATAAATRETEHFWCRLAPEGPYIDSQRDHKAFGFRDEKIFLSEDNGQNWAYSATFPDAENIYYSTDSGETVKIAYSFGQNPHFQEKGTEPESFLGDPDNATICRHIHAVTYHPAERAFYACTGDINRGHGNECHWLRGEYDPRADRWDWRVVVSVNSNSRYKSGGINFVDGQLYWAADANGPKRPDEKHDRGIFRCDPADLADPKKHTLLFHPQYEVANMIIEDQVILAGHYAPASTYATGIIISPDLGKTWAKQLIARISEKRSRQASGPLSMGSAIESITTCFSPKEVDSKTRYGVPNNPTQRRGDKRLVFRCLAFVTSGLDHEQSMTDLLLWRDAAFFQHLVALF